MSLLRQSWVSLWLIRRLEISMLLLSILLRVSICFDMQLTWWLIVESYDGDRSKCNGRLRQYQRRKVGEKQIHWG
jgi:hypothetical protein